MKTLLAWAAEHTLAFFTVVGVLVYGIVRLANAMFYGEFGVTPEEVGIDYQETLAQSALTVLVMTFVFAAIFAAAFVWYVGLFLWVPRLFAAVERRLLPKSFARGADRLENVRARRREATRWRPLLAAHELLLRLEYDAWGVRVGRRLIGRAAAVAVAAAITFTAAGLVLGARALGQDARQGDPVARERLFGIPLLHIQAESADLASTDETPLSRIGIESGRCHLYLGAAGGTTYLYAFDRERGVGRTLRISSDRITVSTPSDEGLCPTTSQP